jgi:betaine-aldehyde dehydrogenase
MRMDEFTVIAGTMVSDAPYVGRHWIAGQWCGSADGRTFDRVSPSHGIVVSRSALGGAAEVDAAVAAARCRAKRGRRYCCGWRT